VFIEVESSVIPADRLCITFRAYVIYTSVSFSRRIRFQFALLLLLLGLLLYATTVEWSFVTYYLVGYLAMLALVEVVASPVWTVRWNRRTYVVLLAGLVGFLGFAGDLVIR